MSLRKLIAPSTLSSQRPRPAHFDQGEKSLFRAKREIFFLDPSHSLGMTALLPSSWRPLRFLREIPFFPIFSLSGKFKYVWLMF